MDTGRGGHSCLTLIKKSSGPGLRGDVEASIYTDVFGIRRHKNMTEDIFRPYCLDKTVTIYSEDYKEIVFFIRLYNLLPVTLTYTYRTTLIYNYQI
ncbi:hypothetical protein P7K49_028442 [Saguinus oedipus]|uniref:Uncharacterized protein n=1 Tax=Saguinus oedipus TaxID=9490 RepID=A0ABQ9UD11_SAGOE|nr:hypothetical protein P7K49_028442 [Saguinus oedipus]